MENNKKPIFTIKSIVYLAFCLSIWMLFTFVPQIGYVGFASVGFTLVPVVVMIISIILIKILKWNPFISGVVSGFLFGLSSLLAAYAQGGVTAVLWQNPIFSLLPRVLVGVVSGLFFTVFSNTTGIIKTIIMLVVWSIIFISCNTLFTLGTILLLVEKFFNDHAGVLNMVNHLSWFILVTNYLPEIAATTIIIIPVYKLITKFG